MKKFKTAEEAIEMFISKYKYDPRPMSKNWCRLVMAYIKNGIIPEENDYVMYQFSRPFHETRLKILIFRWGIQRIEFKSTEKHCLISEIEKIDILYTIKDEKWGDIHIPQNSGFWEYSKNDPSIFGLNKPNNRN